MGQRRYSWWKPYASALRESERKKMIACVEEAMNAMERRYAEWGNNPGTAAELKAIRKAISALQRRVELWDENADSLEERSRDPKIAS
jgi:biotin-(acetyl-CoA carboxylase) ligase